MGVRRKCSKCGGTGHNSRTCRNDIDTSRRRSGGMMMKLFGVELRKLESEKVIKNINNGGGAGAAAAGGHQRKKGVAWSEEEHTLFLIGLEKLGKGNWRGISRNFVTTRTSTQVASHAQKYFIRRNNNNNNKNTSTSTFLSNMMRKNEAACCVYMKKIPIHPPLITSSQLPNASTFSATHNSPSLELTLAPPPPLFWDRRPLLLWKNQFIYSQ